LAEKPLLLGVCHGTCFTFLRVTIPAEVPKKVALGEKFNTPLVIGKLPARSGFDMTIEEQLLKFLDGLKCWAAIISNPPPVKEKEEVSSSESESN
jgi:hypothetical protein